MSFGLKGKQRQENLTEVQEQVDRLSDRSVAVTALMDEETRKQIAMLEELAQQMKLEKEQIRLEKIRIEQERRTMARERQM